MTTEEIVQYITLNITPIVACVASIVATLVSIVRMVSGLKDETADAIKKQSKDFKVLNDRLDAIVTTNAQLVKENEKLIAEISRIKGSSNGKRKD